MNLLSQPLVGHNANGVSWRLVLLVSMLCALPALGQQVPLPPVDLGATSFVDGIGGPGVFLQNIVEPFHASQFNGSNGQKLPGSNSIDTFASITEVAYTSRYRIAGAYWGGELLVPVVHVDLDTDLGVRGSQTGIGDLIFSPFLLQWPEKKLFGKPFYQRLHVAEFVVPTGRYDRNAAVNVSSHVVSAGPHYAFTLLLSPNWETSARLHYVWNSANNDPNPGYNASSIQPGQAFHFNATLSRKLHPRLRAGVAGYYLKGTTDPKIGSVSLANSREQIGGIGPGLWVATKPLEIYMHVFFETGAENRPQGVRYVMRFVKIFPAKPKTT